MWLLLFIILLTHKLICIKIKLFWPHDENFLFHLIFCGNSNRGVRIFQNKLDWEQVNGIFTIKLEKKKVSDVISKMDKILTCLFLKIYIYIRNSKKLKIHVDNETE